MSASARAAIAACTTCGNEHHTERSWAWLLAELAAGDNTGEQIVKTWIAAQQLRLLYRCTARRLLLADRVESSQWYARAAQRLIELVTVPLGGEHFRRRPITPAQALGYAIERHQRFKLGIVERLAARKPHAGG